MRCGSSTVLDADVPNLRQIRAVYTPSTITVYQAFSHEIANRAIEAQTFVAPFRFGRMTWIKPSFLWMMYRSGWAGKTNQQRILAIDISRTGFQWCLDNGCLTRFDTSIHPSRERWLESMAKSTVRVQWDPERSLQLQPLAYRAIQIGLGIGAVQKYVNEWIKEIRDVTTLAHEIVKMLEIKCDIAAERMLPKEAVLYASAPHLGLT